MNVRTDDGRQSGASASCANPLAQRGTWRRQRVKSQERSAKVRDNSGAKSVQCDMKMLKLTGLFAGGLLLGVVAASWWWSHVLSSQMASKSVDVAFRAAEEVEWLAHLRLNEPTNVISQLENSINVGVLTLAQWEDAAPLDEKSRSARDRFLVPVKVYRESYPARDDKVANIDAAPINALLAKVPARNPKSVCRSGVCRLDDLRQSGTNAALSSPTK